MIIVILLMREQSTVPIAIICGPSLTLGKMQLSGDPRRADRERRYKPPPPTSAPAEDLTTDYMNILGMVFSMCGLMMRLKWCAWTAVFCSSVSFANSRVSDDTKQIISSFMLSISAVVMSYLQNPAPMSPPWASLTAYNQSCHQRKLKNQKRNLLLVGLELT
ncbi:unnamed protein product [Leptosia nina]|uniref:Protein Asterix n=1 Tax=Leptosia nina TaxID=320188 RepID=A0AAV1JS59_9NEOP